MSNENYNVEVTEHKCFCQSKWFKKLLMTTLGSFLGVFLALSLFAALHKPPMPAGCPCGCGCPMMRQAMHHHHHFDRGMRGDFHKKMMKEAYDRKAPVRVEIDE